MTRFYRPDDIPLMDGESLMEMLREATEDDVALVLPRLIADGAAIVGTNAALLEFFNRMLDELTGERAAAEEGDDVAVSELTERLRRGHPEQE